MCVYIYSFPDSFQDIENTLLQDIEYIVVPCAIQQTCITYLLIYSGVCVSSSLPTYPALPPW